MKMGTVAEVQVAMPWGLLAMKTWNDGSLEPMLVIHGADDNAASFDSLIPLLSPNFHYVCVDLPGHGFSTALTPGLPISFMHLVTALRRLIFHFGWKQFSILGHSFGAQIALVLAAAEYVKVQRLILLDGTARVPLSAEVYLTRCNMELDELMQTEDRLRPQDATSTYDDFLQKRVNGVFPVSNKAAEAVLARMLVKTQNGYYSTADIRRCFKTMAHMSEEVHLYNCSTLVCPVLLVFPFESKMYEIHCSSEFHHNILEVLLSSNALSRLERIIGSHNVHCYDPDPVAIVVNKFLMDTKDAQRSQKCKL